jgi:hypothetical protein
MLENVKKNYLLVDGPTKHGSWSPTRSIQWFGSDLSDIEVGQKNRFTKYFTQSNNVTELIVSFLENSPMDNNTEMATKCIEYARRCDQTPVDKRISVIGEEAVTQLGQFIDKAVDKLWGTLVEEGSIEYGSQTTYLVEL